MLFHVEHRTHPPAAMFHVERSQHLVERPRQPVHELMKVSRLDHVARRNQDVIPLPAVDGPARRIAQ